MPKSQILNRIRYSLRSDAHVGTTIPAERLATEASSDGPSVPLGAGRLLDASLRRQMAEVIAGINLDTGGGAALLKALLLADLVIDRPVRRAVEIGVYRGRLMLPLALAIKQQGFGEIIGIDPYSASAAAQYDDHKVGIDLRYWPSTINWRETYDSVCRLIAQLNLDDCCKLIRARSDEVADRFPYDSIDLLHIDGNHDQAAVERDLELYLPRVTQQGGYVVLDDASWPSVRSTFNHLHTHHELVFQLFDTRGFTVDGVGGNDFAIFRIRNDSRQ